MDFTPTESQETPSVNSKGEVTWTYKDPEGRESEYKFPKGSWGAALLHPDAEVYVSQGMKIDCFPASSTRAAQRIWNVESPFPVDLDHRFGTIDLYTAAWTVVKPPVPATGDESASLAEHSFGIRVKLKIRKYMNDTDFLISALTLAHSDKEMDSHGDIADKQSKQTLFATADGSQFFRLAQHQNLLEAVLSQEGISADLTTAAIHVKDRVVLELDCYDIRDIRLAGSLISEDGSSSESPRQS